MKHSILFILLFIPFLSYAQDCNCESNFNWTKRTFEDNDAGFAYAIEKKGQEAYQQHNQIITNKIKNIEDSIECTQTIYEWLRFFRNGHIAIRRTGNQQAQTSAKENDKDIIESFENWEKLDVDLPKFKQYLASKQEHDFEGIWLSNPYEIGIKKVGDEYLGFIIKADGVYWSEGQIKLRIASDLSCSYYMRDHSAQDFYSAELLGSNYLEMGFVTLKRKTPVSGDDAKFEKYFKALSAQEPYFEEIDSQTVLIRIPSFNGLEKPKIDSVIIANKKVILRTQNLIIDLRNNGGGSDRSYSELLPLLYTNPIRNIGVEMFSTPLNNQRMLDFVNNDEYGLDEDTKKWAQKSYDTLSMHIGEFVMLKDDPITETMFDSIYAYPSNIGVIINENNGSTTEQFLLAAKQSKKVKLFGTTTAGVLDISNMYFVRSPCEEFELGYSLSKSMRIPDMEIDDKGIQPDYYIDKEIPKYDWIQFVMETLN